MPAVSIIMNVRNGAATLRPAIESALTQTYPDWELIVWDDCSTDDSAKVVAEFQDPRIRYFFAPQQTSLGQARDAAMRHAQGEWLAFLDQDDLWLARKLELQLALADAPHLGLIYGRTLCFYPMRQPTRLRPVPRIRPAARRRNHRRIAQPRLFRRHEFGAHPPLRCRSNWQYTSQYPHHS